MGPPAPGPAHRPGPGRRDRPGLQGPRRDPARPLTPACPSPRPRLHPARRQRPLPRPGTHRRPRPARRPRPVPPRRERTQPRLRPLGQPRPRPAPGRAVVLLNSDAQVFGDWLDRLVAHAEPKVEPRPNPGPKPGRGCAWAASRRCPTTPRSAPTRASTPTTPCRWRSTAPISTAWPRRSTAATPCPCPPASASACT